MKKVTKPKMIVETIRMDKSLVEAWRKKHGKNGDQRIRQLMIEDLTS